MGRLKKIEILRTDLLEHPAVRTWGELGPRRLEPERIEVLKGEKKSSVYRLAGVWPDGSAVIAKRCREKIALVERAIYEEVLPELPVPTPRYYGCVEEDDGAFHWLFLEDVTAERFAWRNERHRELAARWFGTMHTGASRVAAAARLPDRGPAHSLGHLRLTRENIVKNLDNPALDAADCGLLREIVVDLDLVESNWSRLERLCEAMPKTLVHGDIAGKNAHVRQDNGASTLVPYDWEMGGWGHPAVDLLHVDLAVYEDTVRSVWPDADSWTLRHWRDVGNLMRGALAPLCWQSSLLAYEWAHREMSGMRIFHPRLRDAIRATEMDCR